MRDPRGLWIPNCALLFKATITRTDFFKKLVVFLSYVFPFENRRRIIHLMASLTLDYNLATRWIKEEKKETVAGRTPSGFRIVNHSRRTRTKVIPDRDATSRVKIAWKFVARLIDRLTNFQQNISKNFTYYLTVKNVSLANSSGYIERKEKIIQKIKHFHINSSNSPFSNLIQSSGLSLIHRFSRLTSG